METDHCARIGGEFKADTEVPRPLKSKPSAGSALRTGENFGSDFGHQDRVFELCGKTPIARANRPTVLWVEHGEATSRIDHGLNREAQPRVQPLIPRLLSWIVRDIRLLVKLATQAMPDVLTDDGVTKAM